MTKKRNDLSARLGYARGLLVFGVLGHDGVEL
jgi:hypothetical protein